MSRSRKPTRRRRPFSNGPPPALRSRQRRSALYISDRCCSFLAFLESSLLLTPQASIYRRTSTTPRPTIATTTCTLCGCRDSRRAAGTNGLPPPAAGVCEFLTCISPLQLLTLQSQLDFFTGTATASSPVPPPPAGRSATAFFHALRPRRHP